MKGQLASVGVLIIHFDRCVRHLRDKVRDPQGLCAEYHKAATGEWPAEKGIESSAETTSFGLRWRGLLALVGQSTGDKRKILPGALSTRQLPLPLLWQRESVAGKHDGSVVVGLIDKVDITNNAVYGEGDLFTPDPTLMPRLAEDVAELRYLTEHGLGGPSVDIQLDDLTFEYRGNEAVVTNGRIAAVTLVQVPAFAETKGAFEIYENNVLVASIGVMRPFEFITLEQWEESKHPRDAEGRFKEKPGGDVPSAGRAPADSSTPAARGDHIDELISRLGQNQFGFELRKELVLAKTVYEVDRTLAKQLNTLTGRTVSTDFTAMDLQSAKETAEGVLRVMEIFPRTRLRAVRSADEVRFSSSSNYAHATYAGELEFNLYWYGQGKLKTLQDSLKGGVAQSWHPPGSEHVAINAIHEATHTVHQAITNWVGEKNSPVIGPRYVGARKQPLNTLRGLEGVSFYADKNTMELVAESSSDVFANGDKAAENSKIVFRLLVEEYEAKYNEKVSMPTEQKLSPQQEITLKVKSALDLFMDKRDASVLKAISEKDLITASQRLLDAPLRGDESIEFMRVLLLVEAQKERKRSLKTIKAQNITSLKEYADRLLLRGRDDGRRTLEQKNWPVRSIAKELGVKVSKGETDAQIIDNILDRIHGSIASDGADNSPQRIREIATDIINAGSMGAVRAVADTLKSRQLDDLGKALGLDMAKQGTIDGKRKRLIEFMDGVFNVTTIRYGDWLGETPEQKAKRLKEKEQYLSSWRKAMLQVIETNMGKAPEAPKPKPKLKPKTGITTPVPAPPTDKDWEKFRKHLEERRDKAGSVAALARELGVSSSTVSNWIKGRKPRITDVVSKELKAALAKVDVEVPDVSTVRVQNALDSLHSKNDPTLLRTLEAGDLRDAVKKLPTKLRSNASRDSMIKALIEDHQAKFMPGQRDSIALITGVSKAGARQDLRRRNVAELIDIGLNLGVEPNKGDNESLIKAILDKTHGKREARIKPPWDPQTAEASVPGPVSFDVPPSARPYNLNIDGIEDIVDKVENELDKATSKQIKTGVMGGAEGVIQGRKEELTFPDGTKLFGKGVTGVREDMGGDLVAKDMADREQLAAKLGHLMDVEVPRTYRSGERQTYSEWVDGEPASVFMGRDIDRYERLLQSNAAKRMGLFDIMVGNSDRNEANMIIDRDNKLHGVDHGLSWQDAKEYFEGREYAQQPWKYVLGPAKQHFLKGDRLRPNPATLQDVQYVRAKLREMEADFDHLGRSDWYRFSHQMLDQLEPFAKGKNSIFGDIEDITHERTLFNEVGDPTEYHVDLSSLGDMVDKIRRINDENVLRGLVTNGGMGGRQERLSFPDGTSMFVKDFGVAANEEQSEQMRKTIDREQLAALVGQVLGAPVPRALRDREGRIATDWVDGVPSGIARTNAQESGNWDEFNRLVYIETTHDGRLLGLLDTLIGNKDRHELNLIVDNDGRLHGIDHGEAWTNPEAFYNYDDPEDRYMHAISRYFGPTITDDDGYSLLTEADVEEIHRRLDTLRPQFERLGRERWLQYSHDVLDDLKLIVKPGGKSIFDPNWDDGEVNDDMGELD